MRINVRLGRDHETSARIAKRHGACDTGNRHGVTEPPLFFLAIDRIPAPRGELTRFLSTSSGTFLVELHSALAALCEKITGALVVCRAALIVLVETCERSTNMPSLFNSLTTAWRIMKRVKSSSISARSLAAGKPRQTDRTARENRDLTRRERDNETPPLPFSFITFVRSRRAERIGRVYAESNSGKSRRIDRVEK